MSYLLLDELYSGVEINQDFYITKDIDIAHIRVGLYKHNTPSDLTLTIYQDGQLLFTSKPLLASDINAEISESYAYGLFRFDFEAGFINLHKKETEERTKYTFKLSASSGDENNFIGVLRSWTDRIYDIYLDGVELVSAPNSSVEPYYFEIYEYKYV